MRSGCHSLRSIFSDRGRLRHGFAGGADALRGPRIGLSVRRGACAAIALGAALAGVAMADQPRFEDVRLVPETSVRGDRFGLDVDISGDRFVAGAPDADSPDGLTLRTGLAYVYARQSGTDNWNLEAVLTASDAGTDDRFGESVAIDGDVIVIGAPKDDHDAGTNSGSIYIFRYDANGETWTEEAKLIPDAVQAADELGRAVAIDGNLVGAGAPLDDDNARDAGAVYAWRYDSNNQTWNADGKIVALNNAPEDQFGQPVEISGDRMVVGVRYDDDNGFSSGSAIVFRYEASAQTWVQEQKIKAPDGAAYDLFGGALDITGDLILAGAKQNEDNGVLTGAAYIFRRDMATGQWRAEAKLLPSDGIAGDSFGHSVALMQSVAVVGARWANAAGTDSGAAYLYSYAAQRQTWPETDRFVVFRGTAFDNFGDAAAISQGRVIIGMPDTDSNTGAALLYDLEDPGRRFGLEISPLPPQSYQETTFRLVNGRPNSNSVLVMSTTGLGSTYFERFDVTFDLENAEQLGDFKFTDEFGNAEWVLPIDLQGQTEVWFQAGQFNRKTELIETIVEGDPFTLDVSPLPPNSFEETTFSVIGAKPDTDVFLALSTTGLGATPVPQLNVTLDILNPAQLGGIARSNAAGEASWIEVLDVAPADAIWFQALHRDQVSNVVATSVSGTFPSLSISPDPLVPKNNFTAVVTDAVPGEETYLAYSTTGLGSTFIRSLQVDLDLDQPRQLSTPRTADASGRAEWNLVNNQFGAGSNVWFQAAQAKLASNVVATSVRDLNFTLAVSPQPLISGQDATFTVTEGNSGTSTLVFYSTTGLGSTFIPDLNLTLDLDLAKRLVGPDPANSKGEIEWVVPITFDPGVDVWFQAAQFENKSNVVSTSVN